MWFERDSKHNEAARSKRIIIFASHKEYLLFSHESSQAEKQDRALFVAGKLPNIPISESYYHQRPWRSETEFLQSGSQPRIEKDCGKSVLRVELHTKTRAQRRCPREHISTPISRLSRPGPMMLNRRKFQEAELPFPHIALFV